MWYASDKIAICHICDIYLWNFMFLFTEMCFLTALGAFIKKKRIKLGEAWCQILCGQEMNRYTHMYTFVGHKYFMSMLSAWNIFIHL